MRNAKKAKKLIVQEYKWLTDIYVAHRGLFDNDNGIPENSLPAFERASANGFAIETDVQMTKDGVLVVFHDDALKRMTGADGNLSDFTLEQLQQLRLLNTDCRIPTFEQFLQAANGANLIVEIKTHPHIGETEQKTYEMLKGYKGNFCIESFNPFIVRWFKVNAPEVVRGQLACNFRGYFSPFKSWLLSNLKFCKWNGSQFVAYDAATLRDNKAVKKFSKTIPIICWTVKSEKQFEELHDCFDNMIFDSFSPIRRDLDKTEQR